MIGNLLHGRIRYNQLFDLVLFVLSYEIEVLLQCGTWLSEGIGR